MNFKSTLAIGLHFLAGCQLTDVTNFVAGGSPSVGEGDLRVASLAPSVQIAGPSGYCIDGESGKRSFGRKGVVLASCVRLAGSDDFDPTFGHLLTAVVVGQAVDMDQLEGFFESEEGLASLSSAGDAQTVRVHGILQTRRAFYIELTDSSRAPHIGGATWKAFLNRGGKLILLSVYQGVGESVAGDAGETIIREFAASVIKANETPS